MPGLGGLRKPQANSPNTGWKNKSFQAFADYMMTAPFAESLRALVDTAKLKRTAIMCAEAVPWRCHRSLIADALIVRGIAVEHIMSPSKLQPHQVHSWAHVEGTEITYPSTAGTDSQKRLF
jgi:uncharacterized protein (DUF488 family)